MKKALVLGAGLVSRPLVQYLLNQPNYQVTVATRTVDKAHALIAGRPNGKATPLLADDTAKLESLVKDHDLAISLLPAPLHPVVAQMCVKHRKHMVTTSYVSPKMRELDKPARDAGVMLLNEIGVDPGIDHMSAMRIIHDVKRRGGKVVSFKSYCGGLPAPEANDNPWGYKFSWSPRAVCTAGKNNAKFRENGKLVDVPGPLLFTRFHPIHIEDMPELESYPNRDSLSYIEVYDLEGIDTMFRGTLRYPGWCVCMKKIVDLGLLDESPVTYPLGTTFAKWTAGFIKSSKTTELRHQVALHLGLQESSNVLDRLEWLGLFSDQPIPIVGQQTTSLDVLAKQMEVKMSYKPGERDMIIMMHQFEAHFPGDKIERIVSSMVDFGEPKGDSSMARTVSLPAAIGARMILDGQIKEIGVHIPVTPEIYNPVLDELAKMKIQCKERTLPQ